MTDVLDPSDYEGKQHYPKMLYGKTEAGELIAITVADAQAHADLLRTDAAHNWQASPADHGIETAPAFTPVPFTKV